MTPPIEDTLRPETVNEVLLLNRIRELHRTFYKAGGYPFSLTDPNLEEVSMRMPFKPTLVLAGYATVESEDFRPDSLRITARSFNGPESLGYAQYVTREQREAMTAFGAANMLGRLHEKLIREFARHLEKESTPIAS